MSEDDFRDGGPDLSNLLNERGFEDAETSIRQRLAEQAQRTSAFVIEEGRETANAVRNLATMIRITDARRARLVHSANMIAEPNYEEAFGHTNDYSDLTFLKDIRRIGRTLTEHIDPLYRNLEMICSTYDVQIEPVFNGREAPSIYGLERSAAALSRVLGDSVKQLLKGVLEFETMATSVYTELAGVHRKLRRKYQGLGGPEEPPDDMMGFFRQMLEMQQKKGNEKKSLIPLYKDNVVLTDTLMDLAEALPRRVESVVPVGKKGRTKVIKKLDDLEVENSADLIVALANDEYAEYLYELGFVRRISEVLSDYYDVYSKLQPALLNVIDTSMGMPGVSIIGSADYHQPMPSPEKMLRKLLRLNFASIRPNSAETQPQNRVERDLSKARQKLLGHLDETISALLNIDDESEKADFAIKRIREAVSLKEDMDDIATSEYEKLIRKDIRGQNEFYIGKTGEIGEFGTERRPTPDIRMKDVVGASFDKAKEHIEEVVEIAKHPRVLKATAPRGTIKSNLLLIGPYGCGKTELARAAAADKRLIGLYVSVADVLTAYMHESVKNVKRMWEEARILRKNSRHTKPVVLIQDEFDSWFETGDRGFQMGDMQQIERVMQEVMDGVVDYQGVFTIALTNRPGSIPPAILRRFKYVDVVGQLNTDERAGLLRHFIKRGMPVSSGIKMADYGEWAEQLDYAPGDVLGKIADELHFKFMRQFSQEHPGRLGRLEQQLYRTERERELTNADYGQVKAAMREFGYVVTKDHVQSAIEHMVKQPAVQRQIAEARKVYQEAEKILEGLTTVSETEGGMGFGQKTRSKLWSP